MSEHHTVAADQAGMELDELLCRLYPLVAKRHLRLLVRRARVLVDGTPARPSQRLRHDQLVSIDLDEEQTVSRRPVATDASVPILYEDEDFLVVDKPADLPVEPDRWDRGRPSLMDVLQARAAERPGPRAAGRTEPGAPFRPRLVHRLDKDTSGAVLVAKHVDAERAARRAFDQGRVRKTYLALVEGEHPLADGECEVIDRPIGPARRRDGRMTTSSKEARPARTRVWVERRFRGYTLLGCEPLTGRTHQLRVHLSESGFPLVVDPLYGRRDALPLSELKSGFRHKPGRVEAPLIARLSLHALRLSFPGAGDRQVDVEAPPPPDLERALRQLAKVRPPRKR